MNDAARAVHLSIEEVAAMIVAAVVVAVCSLILLAAVVTGPRDGVPNGALQH